MFLFVFVSCDDEKKSKNVTLQKEIFLSDLVIVDEDLSIAYQVPQDWIKMPTATDEKMVARIHKQGEDEFVIYTPKSFYFNNQDDCLLRVGEIRFKNNSFNDSLSIENYVDLLKKYNKGFVIEYNTLQNSNFPIQQMKIIKKNLMSFKFLFKNYNKEIIQFDFSIEEENFAKLYPTIIASTQSIKLL